MERVSGGIIEQGEIATNAPMSTLRNGGPPVPDDGLSIQIVTSGNDGASVRQSAGNSRRRSRHPHQGPQRHRHARSRQHRDAVGPAPDDGERRVRGSGDAGRASAGAGARADRGAGRRRRRSPQHGPAQGYRRRPVRRRHAPAAIFWRRSTCRCRSATEIKNGTITYAINADIVNFSADRFLMSQKVESQTLRAVANNQGYQIRGDMRIGGVPATAEMRRNSRRCRCRGQAAGDAGRCGAQPPRLGHRRQPDRPGGGQGRRAHRPRRRSGEPARGRGGLHHGQDRKPAAGLDQDGEPAGARELHLCGKGQGGPLRGHHVRRRRRLDQGQRRDRCQRRSRSSPISRCSECPTATRRRCGSSARRTISTRRSIRGDVYDGRGFVKTSMSGSSSDAKQRRPGIDIDLDAKVGAVMGLKGEALRNVDLHLTRRGGTLRSLALNAKIGSDGTLVGEMRGRPGERQMVYHRIDRRRSAVPFHRHLFADDRRADVGRDGPAELRRHPAGRPPQRHRFHACGGRPRSTASSPARRTAPTTASSSRACGWASPVRPARCRSTKAWSAVRWSARPSTA